MDFTRWSGHEAKIELTAPVATAAGERKRFRALLLGLDGSDVVIRDTSIGIADIKFPFCILANAKLVLTDKLINENLKTRESATDGASARAGATKQGE
jgi:ribosome maturation factor RimP